MRVVVPLIFSPGEYLLGHPEQLDGLVRRAAAAGKAALTAMDKADSVILVHDEGQARPAASVPEALAVPLPADAPPRALPAAAPLLPTGVAEALDALTGPSETTLFLDPRSPAPAPETLAAARRRFRDTGADILFSARPPEDHPCQARRFYELDGPRRPLGQGARIRATEDGTEVELDVPLPRDTILSLYRPTRAFCLSPVREDESGVRIFGVPPELVPDEDMTWATLRPVPVPGPGHRMLPFAPEGAPWHLDRMTSRVMNGRTGRWIAGRQDFPDVLTPDGNFCILAGRVLDAVPGQKPPNTIAFRHDPAYPVRIENAFASLAWSILENEEALPLA